MGTTLIGDALLPGGRARAAITVVDGTIAAVEPAGAGRAVDGVIAPGFVDLQVNGAFGIEVAPDAAALEALSARLPATGVTAFLPTAITWPVERYGALLDAVDAAVPAGAAILGAHLEGPFLSPARPGAHDPALLRGIDLGVVRAFARAALVTLAPELPGALEAIRVLREHGVVVSVGHTDATASCIHAAADAGATMATHLFNAMRGLGHREPGVVGAVLDDDRLTAGIIMDGVHVAPAALRIAHRSSALALVTDAMAAAGMGDGEYGLSGRPVRVRDGAARLADGTLAGSVVTMDAAVRNAMTFLDVPLGEAVRMASAVPAGILGLDRKGRIEAGADADLVVLGEDGEVRETIVAGRPVFP